MTSLSPYFMVTTLGIQSNILAKNDTHRKIEKNPKTSIITEVDPKRVVATSEKIYGFKLLATIPLASTSTYISALLNYTTGFVVIRRFTSDPRSVAIARTQTSTRFCPCHDQNWCIDLDNQFTVPSWFLDELQTRL